MPDHPPDVVSQLEREWPVLVHGRLRAALPGWRRAQPSLGRIDQPERLLSFLHRASPGESDKPLLGLLTLARTDADAGRFVLQAILPALKAQAALLARRSHPREEIWESLLVQAWTRIRTYPCETRTHAVAANLSLDVWHQTSRELDRCTDADDADLESESLDSPLAAAARARQRRRRQRAIQALLAAAKAGVISRRDAALILRSRFEDVPLCLLAEQDCVPYQALVKRRQRAEQRLRQWPQMQGNVQIRRRKVLTSSGQPPTRPGHRTIVAAASGRTHLDRREDL